MLFETDCCDIKNTPGGPQASCSVVSTNVRGGGSRVAPCQRFCPHLRGKFPLNYCRSAEMKGQTGILHSPLYLVFQGERYGKMAFTATQ